MNSLTLLEDRDETQRIVLRSPSVGVWVHAPKRGQVLVPGDTMGALHILGQEHPLLLPNTAQGVIVACSQATAFAYGDVMVTLENSLATFASDNSHKETAHPNEGLSFCSTSAGRFYVRPSPDKAPFVQVGDVVEEGQPLFLLEVMKTFSRIPYGGALLPTKAKIIKIHLQDGDELEAGQVVFTLAPL